MVEIDHLILVGNGLADGFNLQLDGDTKSVSGRMDQDLDELILSNHSLIIQSWIRQNPFDGEPQGRTIIPENGRRDFDDLQASGQGEIVIDEVFYLRNRREDQTDRPGSILHQIPEALSEIRPSRGHRMAPHILHLIEMDGGNSMMLQLLRNTIDQIMF